MAFSDLHKNVYDGDYLLYPISWDSIRKHRELLGRVSWEGTLVYSPANSLQYQSVLSSVPPRTRHSLGINYIFLRLYMNFVRSGIYGKKIYLERKDFERVLQVFLNDLPYKNYIIQLN